MKDRDKIGEVIYFVYFALMVGARAAGLYEGMLIYNISLVIGMILFACKMIVTRHTVKEYLVALGFMLIAGIVYIHTGEKGLIVYFTMMLGMKAVSVNKVIKVGALTAGVIIISKIFLGVFGLLPEIYYPQEREGIGMMFRHSLGYAHPNTLHMNVLMLSMMVMYLVTTEVLSRKKDIAVLLFSSLVILGFNLYIFRYSGSRTGILACVVYLFVNAWLYLRKEIGIFEKTLLFSAFPLVSFVAIGFPLLLKGKVFDFINMKLFTTRLSLARYFWNNNSISLFGIRLNNPDENFTTYGIDMAQLYLFLQLGLVAFILMAILTTWFVYQAIKENKRAELAVLMGMLFLGIWEPLLYNLGYKNFVYVFMGSMVYECINGTACEERIVFDKKIDVRKIGIVLLISMIIGIVASSVYIGVTNPPSALYLDRAEGESGNKLDAEAFYLDEDEIEQIKANGDIVIGYSGEEKPMYRFDSSIAQMEYRNRILSTGVWSAVLGKHYFEDKACRK